MQDSLFRLADRKSSGSISQYRQYREGHLRRRTRLLNPLGQNV